MSQLTASTIAAGSGDSVTTVLTNHEANGILLQKTFYDSADPGSPVNGQHWIRSDEQKKYAYTSGAKTEVLWKYVLNQTLAAQANEITNVHLEEIATGSLPAPAAGQKSRIIYDSTRSQALSVSAAAIQLLSWFNGDASEHIAIPCLLNVAGAGQAATASTISRKAGWLMDATADELNFAAMGPVPAGWTAANDLLLEVEFILPNAETNGDDAQMLAKWLSLTPASGDGTDKTATTSATTTYDIGTASAQYDHHKLRITIDHDDATNPVAAGDYISGYLQLASIAQVVAVVVTNVTLLVPATRYAYA